LYVLIKQPTEIRHGLCRPIAHFQSFFVYFPPAQMLLPQGAFYKFNFRGK
jgi:hypothetical protein